jgi:hypothetical protein
MPVTMICPNLKCGRTVVAAESARGKVVRCAHCQILFLVPRDVASARDTKPNESASPDETRRRGRR